MGEHESDGSMDGEREEAIDGGRDDATGGEAGERGASPRGWSSPKIEVRERDGHRGVYATSPIAAGERLATLARVFVERPSKYTIQIDERRHQAGTSETDDFFNHSCEPNCFLDFEALAFVAARPIAVGEHLSFNYLTSEWDMDEPFTCWCERPGDHCVHDVRGFKHLPRARQLALRPWISPFLRRQLEALLAADAASRDPGAS